MDRKKPSRKAEPPSKRRIAWPRWTGFRGKTVWDWLQLLIVPLALVSIGLVFTLLQDARQQEIEDRRVKQAQEIENQRAEAEQELARQRAQDEALQAYFDQMSTLLLEKDLRNSEEESEVRTLARARTLTILGRLDPSRKTQVMQFLVEGYLVQGIEGEFPSFQQPIISLGIRTSFDPPGPGGRSMYVDTRSVGVDLSGVDLSNANLIGAQLIAADLSDANLVNTDLSDADLTAARLNGANLEGTAPAGYTDLSGADLAIADLGDANLEHADLSGADLEYTDISDANLEHADLSGANLSNVRGVTNEELEQQVDTLAGATMPNGQKYEDWLKNKGSGEDEENSGED